MDKPAPTDNSTVTRQISFPDYELIRSLCGERNAHLGLLEKEVGVSLNLRGNVILLKGRDWEVDVAERVLKQLYGLLEADYPLYPSDIQYAVRILSGDRSVELKTIFKEEVYISSKKKLI
ncbi:MAG: phosphate starvation-inducible protein PhoH, partial [Proteobacteria bacterium]|nr:phosphate starvation-inducible protein PhoH [Pseudomonadota bacterium]